MPEIIPPKDTKKNKTKSILSHKRFDYVYLIVGAIAIVWGFLLLIDIAVGLILLFLGFTAVNQWLLKK